VFYEDGSPWQITPHWALVDGRAVIVGLDIRSFVEIEYDPEDPDSLSGQRVPVDPVIGLAEVTQQVLRSVSISHLRQESAAHVAEGLRAFSSSLTALAPPSVLSDFASDAAETLTASGQPRKRRSPASDALLTRVAEIYKAAVESGSKAPAAAVEDLLRAEGISISTKGGRGQVRKWIQRARQKGLLPPVR
jgi:hypothetical protein